MWTGTGCFVSKKKYEAAAVYVQMATFIKLIFIMFLQLPPPHTRALAYHFSTLISFQTTNLPPTASLPVSLSLASPIFKSCISDPGHLGPSWQYCWTHLPLLMQDGTPTRSHNTLLHLLKKVRHSLHDWFVIAVALPPSHCAMEPVLHPIVFPSPFIHLNLMARP